MKLGDIIHEYRTSHEMSMGDFAKLAGVSKAYIGFLEKGVNPKTGKDFAPSIKTIQSVAKAMHIDFDMLFNMLDGYVTISSAQPAASDDIDALIDKYPELHHVEKRSFPMRGDIACGSPIVANEEHDSFIEADADIDADFCLRAKGDSMINARIHDGDIVFIKKCTAVDDGDIAAVIIDEDTTLKRVKYDKKNNILILIAENPAYEPLVFVGEQLNHVHIIGKAVFFQAFF